MSYSVSVKGATKTEAKQNLALQLAGVLEAQSAHSADMDQAAAAANAFIDILPDDETQDVSVSVSGSIGWKGELGAHTITSASVNIGAILIPKVAP